MKKVNRAGLKQEACYKIIYLTFIFTLAALLDEAQITTVNKHPGFDKQPITVSLRSILPNKANASDAQSIPGKKGRVVFALAFSATLPNVNNGTCHLMSNGLLKK
jgi:hypothetical protein